MMMSNVKLMLLKISESDVVDGSSVKLLEVVLVVGNVDENVGVVVIVLREF